MSVFLRQTAILQTLATGKVGCVLP